MTTEWYPIVKFLALDDIFILHNSYYSLLQKLFQWLNKQVLAREDSFLWCNPLLSIMNGPYRIMRWKIRFAIHFSPSAQTQIPWRQNICYSANLIIWNTYVKWQARFATNLHLGAKKQMDQMYTNYSDVWQIFEAISV